MQMNLNYVNKISFAIGGLIIKKKEEISLKNQLLLWVSSQTPPSQAPQLRNRSNWGACDGGVCEDTSKTAYLALLSRMSSFVYSDAQQTETLRNIST